jgi:hypothetical protein
MHAMRSIISVSAAVADRDSGIDTEQRNDARSIVGLG